MIVSDIDVMLECVHSDSLVIEERAVLVDHRTHGYAAVANHAGSPSGRWWWCARAFRWFGNGHVAFPVVAVAEA